MYMYMTSITHVIYIDHNNNRNAPADVKASKQAN